MKLIEKFLRCIEREIYQNMCGILFHYKKDADWGESEVEFDENAVQSILETQEYKASSTSDLFNSLIPKVFSRGPNYSKIHTKLDKVFCSSVLSLRSPFTKQPLECSNYVIQFNGELYNQEIDGNDTQFIQDLLQTNSVVDTIRKLDGEFALVVFDVAENQLFFGRDSVGKRSLTYFLSDDELYISSVQPGSEEREKFIDCDNGSIFNYDFNKGTLNIIPSGLKYTINSSADEEFSNIENRLSNLNNVLTESITERIFNIQPLHSEDSKSALFSILFSGGLDCTVIAGIAASISKPDTTIDLLNVGFDNPRTGMKAGDAPDRKLAINTWINLSLKYSHVKFNLIEINIPYEEYLEARPKVIELMYPKSTEMDLSIAIAFYFASRGKGTKLTLNNTSTYESAERTIDYQSKAKVLLSGLGADELYGGYHKFANKDNESLAEELTRQINNIHERNLQRDDKIISHNGVEVRYPFLSHHVIKFSTESIEINYKISKFILRKLASELGMSFVAEEPKRAIQFGAKSAKMTANGNKKGTDELK